VSKEGDASGRSDAAQQASASDWRCGACPLPPADLCFAQSAFRMQHDIRASGVGFQPAHGRHAPAIRPTVMSTTAMRRREIPTLDSIAPRRRGVNPARVRSGYLAGFTGVAVKSPVTLNSSTVTAPARLPSVPSEPL